MKKFKTSATICYPRALITGLNLCSTDAPVYLCEVSRFRTTAVSHQLTETFFFAVSCLSEAPHARHSVCVVQYSFHRWPQHPHALYTDHPLWQLVGSRTAGQTLYICKHTVGLIWPVCNSRASVVKPDPHKEQISLIRQTFWQQMFVFQTHKQVYVNLSIIGLMWSCGSNSLDQISQWYCPLKGFTSYWKDITFFSDDFLQNSEIRFL